MGKWDEYEVTDSVTTDTGSKWDQYAVEEDVAMPEQAEPEFPTVTEDLQPVPPDPYQFQKDSPFVAQDPKQLLNATAPPAPSGYMIDGQPLSREEFKSRLYDDDMVEKMQSGQVKLDFPQDEEMVALIERQSQAGSRTDDKWDYLMAGLAELGAGVMGAQSYVNNILREGLGLAGISMPKGPTEIMSEMAADDMKELAEKQIEKTRVYEQGFLESIEQGNYLNASDMAMNMIVQSAPLSIAAATTGGATGLATLGTIAASAEYAGSDKEQYDGLTNAEKVMRSTAVGGFEYLGEKVTGGILSKNFKLLKTGLKNTVKKAAEVGGEQAAQAVAVELGKKMPIKMFQEYGIDIVKEGGSELITELGQMGTDDLMGVKDYTAADYLHNGLEALSLGAVGGSVIGSPTAGMGIKRYADEKLKKGDGDKLKARVDAKVEDGTYTKSEGEKIKVAVDNRTEAVNSVPEEMVKNTEVVDLVNKKQDLEKETIDPVLAPIQDAKIKEIDTHIQEKVAPILEAQAEMDEIMKEVEAEKKKAGEEKAMKNKLKLYDKLLADENIDPVEKRIVKQKKKIVEEKLESYQNKKEEEKLTSKKESDAVQKPEPAGVDVRQQARDGEKMGERNPEEKAAEKSQEEVDQERLLREELGLIKDKDDGRIETDNAIMDGVVTDVVQSNDVDIRLPEKGYLISDVTLRDGKKKGVGSGQEIYKKALDEHGVLYSVFPISSDALRVQEKLVEKGIVNIEQIILEDGTEVRKITKSKPKKNEKEKGQSEAKGKEELLKSPPETKVEPKATAGETPASPVDISESKGAEITWENTIKPGNIINYHAYGKRGRSKIIEVKKMGDRYQITLEDGTRLAEDIADAHDSYLLYQNGKTSSSASEVLKVAEPKVEAVEQVAPPAKMQVGDKVIFTARDGNEYEVNFRGNSREGKAVIVGKREDGINQMEVDLSQLRQKGIEQKAAPPVDRQSLLDNIEKYNSLGKRDRKSPEGVELRARIQKGATDNDYDIAFTQGGKIQARNKKGVIQRNINRTSEESRQAAAQRKKERSAFLNREPSSIAEWIAQYVLKGGTISAADFQRSAGLGSADRMQFVFSEEGATYHDLWEQARGEIPHLTPEDNYYFDQAITEELSGHLSRGAMAESWIKGENAEAQRLLYDEARAYGINLDAIREEEEAMAMDMVRELSDQEVEEILSNIPDDLTLEKILIFEQENGITFPEEKTTGGKADGNDGKKADAPRTKEQVQREYDSAQSRYEAAKSKLAEKAQANQKDIFGNAPQEAQLFAPDLQAAQKIVDDLKRDADILKSELDNFSEIPDDISPRQQEISYTETAQRIRDKKIGKGNTFMMVDFGIGKAVYNGALEFAARQVEKGTALGKAINNAIKWVDEQMNGKKWDKGGFAKHLNDQYKINVQGKEVEVRRDDSKATAKLINGFYSPLEQGILDAKVAKTTGREWMKKLRGTTEGDELKWTGVEKFLNDNADKSLTKKQLQDFMRDNRIEVVEVVKGGEPSDAEIETFMNDEAGQGYTREEAIEYLKNDEGSETTKYHQYQTEGERSNYKEVLVTLPTRRDSIETKWVETNPGKGWRLQGAGEVFIIKTGNGKYTIHDYTDSGDVEMRGEFPEEYETLDQAKHWAERKFKVGAAGLTKGEFRSGHFDEPNILVHLRMNTRMDVAGKKTLFLEEIQSDWGQKGKKEGFAENRDSKKEKFLYDLGGDYHAVNKGYGVWADATTEQKVAEYARIKKRLADNNISEIEFNESLYQWGDRTRRPAEGIPSAPFVTETPSWVKLGLKVALKEAVDQGADKIAWTTGEQQNERYDLSKQVDYIQYEDGFGNNRYVDISHHNGITTLYVDKTSGKIIEEKNQSLGSIGKKLEDVVGKDIAQKILEDKKGGRLEGEGLKIGGKGMVGFYGSPRAGKLGIVGEVAKALTGQEPGKTEIQTKSMSAGEIVRNTEDVKKYSKSGYTFYDNGEQVSKQRAYELIERGDRNLEARNEQASQSHSIDITPELKKAVEKGLPLFGSDIKARIDRATEATIDFLKDNNIISNDPNIQKMGFVDLEAAIRAVGELIKKGIDLHGDIKRAVNEAIDKFKTTTFYKSLKPDAQTVIEEKIREQYEPKEEARPVTPEPISEGEGKKALASRVAEGDAPKEVQDAIEKHGLNYSIESHPEAEAKAAAFIAEVGVEKALKAARTGKIDGGAQTFVWTSAIDAVHNEFLEETNPAKKEKLLEKETDLINEFDERVRSQGRGISALQAAYQVSDLGYRLGAILNRAKEAAGENPVSEILKTRLTELSKKFDEVSKKYAEAEKKLKESPPEPIIKEPKVKTPRPSLSPEESTRKSELGKKYRGALNDVTRVLTLLAEKDFREYAALVFKEAAGDFKTFAREMINNVGKEIREYLPKLYKDLGGKENPEMQSIQSKLKREIDEYERRKREKDFTKKEPKEKPTLDEETFNLLVEKNRLKEEIDTEIEKERLKNRPMGKKIEDAFVDAVSLPKSLMASADMSAPLRQGAILSFRHPIMATRAMKEMFKQAFSDKAHRDWLARLKSTPKYYVIKKAELYLAEPTARLNAKEEQFISNIAEKIPIWGKVVKGSQRAYTGYLNKLRVDTFTAFHDALLREGVKGKELDAELKAYAEFINNASGRGTLGKFEESAPLLNAAFFSPRYVVSRFNLINPIRYAKMPTRTRIEAMKTMGAYLGVGLMTMALAQAGGAEVEDDPRSADFGKIKIGNTRYDMWAGMTQVAVLLSRMATGETKSISGQTRKLGEGYKATTRGDVLLRFGRSKLSPSAGVATDFLVGKDFNGNEVTVKDEVLKSVLPLWASDIRKIYNEAGAEQAAAAGAASFFGVGVQNYKPGEREKTEKSQVIPSAIPK